MVVVIKMRGLPFEASAREIREFYRGLEIKEEEIHLAPNENGKASGVAFAIFHNDDDARKAMFRDRQYLGKRYVNLFLSSVNEMEKILREGVHERRKNPAINSEPTANANKLGNPERNKSESAQIRSRGDERNGRTSRNRGENYRSDRSRSPLRSHNDELTRRRTVVGEAHESISMSASSGLDELLESHRRYEQQESLSLLATLSNYEMMELERQLMATENKGYKDIDFKSTLLGEDSTVSLSRLNQEKLTESPWGFPQSYVTYEPNHMAMVHEDLKSNHIRDRVAELFNCSHNIDSLMCSTDLGLGRITAGHDLYHGNVVGGHDGDPVMVATGGFNYIHETVGEVPEQNIGQEKVLGGHAHPLILNYENMARSRGHDLDQGRLQERQNQSHERVDRRRDQENGSGRVAGEHECNYKKERRGRDQGREKVIGGHHHVGKHEKGTIRNDRKHESLNKGHGHNLEKVLARGQHHASDHGRVRVRSDQRNGRAAGGQKSGHEKVAGHRGHDDSRGKAAVGHGSNHNIKKDSKSHELDRDGERQKARHDRGYKGHKINHDDRKISGAYDPDRTSRGHSSESIGSGNNGRRQNDFKNVDGNDESRGICINMVGLPYSCTEPEVAEFFKGLRLIGIHLRRNLSGAYVGKTNGEAFVVFQSLDDCMEAVERNHRYIRDRYVKVRKCPKEVMYEAIQQEVNVFGEKAVRDLSSSEDYGMKDLNQGLNSQLSSSVASEIGLGNELPAFHYPIFHPGMDATPSFGQEMIQPTVYGYTNDNLARNSAMSQLAQGANISVSDIKAGCVVGIRNLPSTVTADEILDFFYGFRVIPDSIRIHYLAPGRSSGDAIVTFMDDKEARIATEQLNHKPVRRRNVQLFPV